MIAIPNMDKPKGCLECWSGLSIVINCEAGKGFWNPNGDRIPPDCPLIEIIPCKECKNSHMTYDGKCKYCDLEKDDDDNFIECYFDGDHFCSYGERRSDER